MAESTRVRMTWSTCSRPVSVQAPKPQAPLDLWLGLGPRRTPTPKLPPAVPLLRSSAAMRPLCEPTRSR